ncbi:ABC transporter ATP-binding protein [Bacteroidota bacterium]
MKILEINKLNKSYGRICAINNLDLVVEEGNIFGFLGPNGSGKTTTLSIILGIIKSDSGEFFWFDKNADHHTYQQIGAMVETPNFFPYLSCKQNLKIVTAIKRIPENDIERVLKIVKLFDRKDSKYKQLSYGMKQRLAIASALLGDPRVLVFDEPTNGLDPEGIAEVREIIISEAKKKKTVILASHILDEVEKVCSHVGILKKGKLISCGVVKEMLVSDDEIIISSVNLNGLADLLKDSKMIKTMEVRQDDIVLILNKDFAPVDINKFASKNGFDLTKIEIKKKTLEDQFLEIVK